MPAIAVEINVGRVDLGGVVKPSTAEILKWINVLWSACADYFKLKYFLVGNHLTFNFL